MIEIKPSSLIGSGVHWLNEEGRIENQCEIIRVSDAAVTLQYLSFLDGRPNGRRSIPLDDILTNRRWVVYDSVEEMNAAFERQGWEL
jgi:hypothetical protein